MITVHTPSGEELYYSNNFLNLDQQLKILHRHKIAHGRNVRVLGRVSHID